jgi:transposase
VRPEAGTDVAVSADGVGELDEPPVLLGDLEVRQLPWWPSVDDGAWLDRRAGRGTRRCHPLPKVLTSMPGVGFRTAATMVSELLGKHFATAAHLASYAGLAPVTHRSGTSIRGEHQSRLGNKRLKPTLYLSVFSALKDPLSRAYYDRKRAERTSHQQTLPPSPDAAATCCRDAPRQRTV